MTVFRGILAALIVLLVGAVTFNGLKTKPPPAVEVQFGAAKKGPIVRTVTGAGKVQSTTTVKISSTLSGDLVSLNVKEGDHVAKGQTLGQIDRRRYDAGLKQAQAAVNAAKADVQAAQVDVDRTLAEKGRVQGLTEKGMAAKAEFEKATADHESAKAKLASLQDRAAQAIAALEQAQTDVSHTTLISPIEGTVIERTREVGERVRGSDFSEDVVMTIAALNTMEVKIEVGEHEVVHLIEDQKAEVKVDALEGQSFEGVVTEVGKKAIVRNQGTEQETTTFPVTVALTSRPPGVLPGMSAEVHVKAESRDSALVVPVQAVTVRPEKMLADSAADVEKTAIKAPIKSETFAKVVFVVDAEKKCHLRRVHTGISSDTEIEILDGLKEGDQIIEGPYRTLAKELKEGDIVEESKPGQGGKRG
ncbi:MAG: efflux RND transporter periplasmic adaptor subunit [Myxococcaceae bacterium]